MPTPIARRGVLAGAVVACAVPEMARAATPSGLDAAVRRAAAGHFASVSVSVYDRRSRQIHTVNGALVNDTASIVKVLVLVTLLRRRRAAGGWLSDDDRTLAERMICYSDNDAGYALWQRAGAAAGVQRMATALGMTATSTAPCAATPGIVTWGRTTTTAADQLLLLRHLGWGSSLVTSADRRYVLGLMGHVASDQRFGLGAAPATVRLKDGWAPRPTHGWRHNSIGFVTGGGRDYAAAILTRDNASDTAGRALCNAVGRALYDALATPLR